MVLWSYSFYCILITPCYQWTLRRYHQWKKYHYSEPVVKFCELSITTVDALSIYVVSWHSRHCRRVWDVGNGFTKYFLNDVDHKSIIDALKSISLLLTMEFRIRLAIFFSEYKWVMFCFLFLIFCVPFFLNLLSIHRFQWNLSETKWINFNTFYHSIRFHYIIQNSSSS